MNVLVFEPLHTGHRYAYIRHLLPKLRATGVRVQVALLAGLESEDFQLHLAGHIHTNEIFELSQADGKYTARNAVRALQNAIHLTSADHALVLVGDGLSQWMGVQRTFGISVLGDCVAECLHFRGGFGYPIRHRRDYFQRPLARHLILKAGWAGIHHLDAAQLDGLVTRRASSTHFDVMPDPVIRRQASDRNSARSRFELSNDEFIIACAGAMNRRKGVPQLFDGWQAYCREKNRPVTLLLAGRFSAETRSHLSSAGSSRQCRVIDRALNESEFEDVFEAADAISVLYPQHTGSASMLLLAALHNKPALVFDYGWIARTTKLFGLGQVVTELSPAFIAKAIETLATNDCISDQNRRKLLLKFHTPANFGAHWCRLIRTRLNLPPDPDFVSWQTIMDELSVK